MAINFEFDEINDPLTRENFRKLNELIRSNPVMGGVFKPFEITAKAAGPIKFKHNLAYHPRDILISFIGQGAVVTVNYAETDSTWMSFTVSAPCTFRVLAGRLG